MNWSFTDVGEVPPVVVTVTSTAPGVTVAGEFTLMVFASTTTTPVAEMVPNFTVLAAVNAVPVIVTGVPPPVGPEFGLTDVTDGMSL